MKFFSTLLGVAACLTTVLAVPVEETHSLAKRYFPQGYITQPANGTAIAPGATFAFKYNPRSDYCLSSYNFTVWLWTSSPNNLLQSLYDGSATGHYFGRYSSASLGVPAGPNPPPPATLTMPDFSKSPGGFGSGAVASNLQVFLGVIEEYNSCGGRVGNQLSLAANYLTYNATS